MELPRRTPTESEKMTALVQLAGTVAHELNNIFTAVAGNLSLLDREFTGEQSVTYRDILRAAQRGIDLTSKLQAFAGRQRLERRSIELNSVVSRTLAKLRNTLSGLRGLRQLKELNGHVQLFFENGSLMGLAEINRYCFDHGVVLNHLQLRKKSLESKFMELTN